MSKNVYITGQGCNRRQLETTKLRKYFDLNGYTIVSKPGKADIIILTTCAFKEKEEDNSVENIRSMMQYDAEVIIFGCLPDIAPARFEEFKDLRHIAPKDLLNIDDFFEDIQVKFDAVPSPNAIKSMGGSPATSAWSKIKSGDLLTKEFYRRAQRMAQLQMKSILSNAGSGYLFICRGCQGKCTYCAIRRSIGSVTSKPLEQILEELQAGVKDGQGHFTILGDDPGCYGLDISTTFPEMLSALIEHRHRLELPATGVSHAEEITFQINEIHPKFMLKYQEPLLEVFKTNAVTGVLCPLQSGSDRVLELMQREHTAEGFTDLLKKVRTANPDIHLSTQVIAGFPSESEEEFEASVKVVSDVKFNEVVFFRYHQKEHTAAAGLGSHLPDETIDKRIAGATARLEKEGIKVYTQCPL